MQQLHIMLCFLLFACLLSHGACIAPVNQDITRTIDATQAIIRVTIAIKTENLGKGDPYSFILPKNVSEYLSYLSISRTTKKKEVKDLDISSQNHIPEIASNDNDHHTSDFIEYRVIAPTKDPQLDIHVVFTHILVPLPKEIAQLENQLVQLFDNHYIISPYHTINQKTIIKLPMSKSIESFTKLQPYSYKGSKLEFGPFKKILPYESSPMTVHYINNNPFAMFSEMTREVEVSHWGQVWLEDTYTLKHAGAKLHGGFSRLDYSRSTVEDTYGNEYGASFRTLKANIPREAYNIYYRDQIGNISTSDMTFKKDHIVLEIDTRFPIFGGWQNEFYIGYSVPTENMLKIDESIGRYTLAVDFFTNFDGVWVEDMELKIILPEGTSNIDVQVPYRHDRSDTTRYTYFDSNWFGGRPVIIIKAGNLVKEHSKQVIISYNFSKIRLIVEPLMIITCFFGFFTICIILSRINKGEVTKKEKIQ